MATFRRDDEEDRPEVVIPPVPPELALGALPAIWGDPAEPHGALHEQAMARFRWADAARDWESSVGIGPYEHDRRLPRARPGPPGQPPATLAERLAALGLSPVDIPRLRRAAGTYDTDPTWRTT